MSQKNPRLIWEGCTVLLDINDGDRMIFSRLSPASTVKIHNKTYSLQPLIGCPFGSFFQTEFGTDGKSVLSRVIPSAQGNNVQENENCQPKDECRDNRALVDNNKAQTLSGEDIDAMRRQGATGDEIIEALITNSSTFENKTSYSQDKYRLKKQKKYAPTVLVRRPFARSICEAYFKKNPAKIGFLRVDSLSLMLSMANVCTNSDVLVVDMVCGLLTGAVAERLGGTGYVCNTYLGGKPYPMDIVRIFNLSDEICKRVVQVPLSDLCATKQGATDQTCQHEDISNSEQTPSLVSMEENGLSSENGMSGLMPKDNLSPTIKTCKSVKAGEKASQEAIKLWKENGFSSLIIAAPDLDTWSLVEDILSLLSPSAPFVIYHQYLQPLATCMHNLQFGKMAIGLQLSEPWFREYQVLPSRTHPCMQMNAFGGYILSGTKICSN